MDRGEVFRLLFQRILPEELREKAMAMKNVHSKCSTSEEGILRTNSFAITLLPEQSEGRDAYNALMPTLGKCNHGFVLLIH